MITLSPGSLCDVCAEEYGPHNYPHSISCGSSLRRSSEKMPLIVLEQDMYYARIVAVPSSKKLLHVLVLSVLSVASILLATVFV